MASINDVYNQLVTVNTSLSQINSSVIAGTNATNAVNASVNTLDGDVKAGFNATISALTVIAQIETAAVQVLFHLTQQADAMICALQQISQNTCGILTQVAIQTQLQKSLAEDTKRLVDIEGSTHPEAVLHLQSVAALRAQIEKCCPPPQPPPACIYDPCPVPKPIEMPPLPKIGTATTGNLA
jgi:hypothetical protein